MKAIESIILNFLKSIFAEFSCFTVRKRSLGFGNILEAFVWEGGGGAMMSLPLSPRDSDAPPGQYLPAQHQDPGKHLLAASPDSNPPEQQPLSQHAGGTHPTECFLVSDSIYFFFYEVFHLTEGDATGMKVLHVQCIILNIFQIYFIVSNHRFSLFRHAVTYLYSGRFVL